MKTYKRYRYPAQIISHAVWLYHRFTLSFRDIEDILAARGVIVSYETIRQWCLKIATPITRQLKKKQGKLGDEWYLDEVFIKLNGKAHYLWRAVDQDGCELDVFVSKRRNKKAALKFFRRLFKTQPRKPRNFKTVKHTQKFLAIHGLINNLFRHQRHLAKASTYRILREKSFEIWTETSCVQNLVIV